MLVDYLTELKYPLIFLKVRAKPGNKLWSFGAGHLTAVIRRHSAALGLAELAPTAYSLRHGGASKDLLERLRPMKEVKRRGRWAGDSSLRRYGKETMLIDVASRIPEATMRAGSLLSDALWARLLSAAPPAFKQWLATVP